MICKGQGSLWHPEKNKIVARYEIETDDVDIIGLAMNAGWEIIDNTPPPAIGAGDFNGGELEPEPKRRGRKKNVEI